VIEAQELMLRRRRKALFERSPSNLGSREIMKALRGEGFVIGRYRTRQLLRGYGRRASMGDVGAYWDNAVVERLFGSLKHDWLYKVVQPTREHMKQDVAAYTRYYNLERLSYSSR